MKLKKKAILYIEGMLDKEEERKFKKKLEKDPELKLFVNKYKKIEAHLHNFFQEEENSPPENNMDLDLQTRQDIRKYLHLNKNNSSKKEKDFLKVLKETSEGPGRIKPIRIGNILNIAATVLFIILIISAVTRYINHKNLANSKDEIFAEFFQPSNDNFLKSLDSRYVYREDGKFLFTTEGKKFENYESNTILRDGSFNYDDLLLFSVLFIQEEEYELADSYLSDLLSNTDKSKRESARWYLSLLTLAEGNLDEAKLNLEILCGKKGQYRRDACQILKTLSKKNVD